MVGNKIILKHSVKASTILEVLISMIIIIIVFGTALMIFTNVTASTYTTERLQAYQILNSQLIATQRNHTYNDFSIEIDEFIIEQKITPYLNYNNLDQITLSALDSHKKCISKVTSVISIER